MIAHEERKIFCLLLRMQFFGEIFSSILYCKIINLEVLY